MLKLSAEEKALLADAIANYDSKWKDRVECDTVSRTIAAWVLADSSLRGEAYYNKEDKLTDFIDNLLLTVEILGGTTYVRN